MKKIVVIGPCGAGKTFFCFKLLSILNYPLFHMDKIIFKSNWERIEKRELEEKLKTIMMNNQSWIIDGNYRETLALRFRHADTIIFLDYPRYIYFYRIVKRYIQHRKKKRVDVSEGCKQFIDCNFIRHNLHFKKETRPYFLELIEKFPDKKVIFFKNPQQLNGFLRTLKAKRSLNANYEF